MQKTFREIDEGLTGYVYLGTIFFLLLALLFIFFLIISVKRRQKMKEEKAQLSIKFQQEMLRTQLEIQEQTLKNISQEIHDNIGQTLSLAKLNLNTIDLQKQNADEKIFNSKELIGKAIQDLRSLSKSLNTDSILSAGLVKGIETEVSIIEHTESYNTEFNVYGDAIRIDPKKELILFRIAQEAINNIIKHSNATGILVNLHFTNEHLTIEVCDNGTGFDLNHGENEGLGLRNMKSRAELIGGTFSIQSSYSGTTIIVTLPIAE